MIDYQPQTVPPRSGIASDSRMTPARSVDQMADQYRQLFQDWVVEHPAAALGVALIVGAGVGWLIKRR